MYKDGTAKQMKPMHIIPFNSIHSKMNETGHWDCIQSQIDWPSPLEKLAKGGRWAVKQFKEDLKNEEFDCAKFNFIN